ncbi:MAG: helix-turn-helix domain-containing protein [Hyphomonas sp.]|nr:helix-turn-helix domain-containing protein [Hyphomonas sp.]
MKSGKVKGVRFETLAKLCEALDCKPGDLLDFGETAAAPGAGQPATSDGLA